LHISDIHTDLEYQPGSLAQCGQPLCCRNSSTQAGVELNENNTAGYWGDYRNCDVPLWTVENMFDYISKNEKVKAKFSFKFHLNQYLFLFLNLSLILFTGLVIRLLKLIY
jgi:hypothetical protein